MYNPNQPRNSIHYINGGRRSGDSYRLLSDLAEFRAPENDGERTTSASATEPEYPLWPLPVPETFTSDPYLDRNRIGDWTVGVNDAFPSVQLAAMSNDEKRKLLFGQRDLFDGPGSGGGGSGSYNGGFAMASAISAKGTNFRSSPDTR